MQILPIANNQVQNQKQKGNVNFGAMRVSGFTKVVFERLYPNKYTSLIDMLAEYASNTPMDEFVANAFKKDGQNTTIDAILNNTIPSYKRFGSVHIADEDILLNNDEAHTFRYLIASCHQIKDFGKEFMIAIQKVASAKTIPDTEAKLIEIQLDKMGKELVAKYDL